MLECVRRGSHGDAFERVVKANILLSGIGFESGGIGTAHAIQNGLAYLPECRGFMHRELVTIGLLAMLHLSDASKNLIDELTHFAHDIGLPVTLNSIRLGNAPDAHLLAAAQVVCTPALMTHVAPHVGTQDILTALRSLVSHAQKNQSMTKRYAAQ